MISLFKKDDDRDETLVAFDKEARKRKIMKPIKAIGNGIKKGVDWCLEHPVEAIGIGSMVVSGGYKVAKLATKHKQMRHEQHIADCRFYDRRYDEYVWSKRKLTNDEKLYLERKYANGKDQKISYRDILTNMGLIEK